MHEQLLKSRISSINTHTVLVYSTVKLAETTWQLWKKCCKVALLKSNEVFMIKTSYCVVLLYSHLSTGLTWYLNLVTLKPVNKEKDIEGHGGSELVFMIKTSCWVEFVRSSKT